MQEFGQKKNALLVELKGLCEDFTDYAVISTEPTQKIPILEMRFTLLPSDHNVESIVTVLTDDNQTHYVQYYFLLKTELEADMPDTLLQPLNELNLISSLGHFVVSSRQKHLAYRYAVTIDLDQDVDGLADEMLFILYNQISFLALAMPILLSYMKGESDAAQAVEAIYTLAHPGETGNNT